MQLQQDADFQHWNVDFGAVHHRARELGVDLIRRPVCKPLHFRCRHNNVCGVVAVQCSMYEPIAPASTSLA